MARSVSSQRTQFQCRWLLPHTQPVTRKHNVTERQAQLSPAEISASSAANSNTIEMPLLTMIFDDQKKRDIWLQVIQVTHQPVTPSPSTSPPILKIRKLLLRSDTELGRYEPFCCFMS
jgi:hypothetical protein